MTDIADLESYRIAWSLFVGLERQDGRSRAILDMVGESVEVDAIPPATLRQLVRDCIERHVDHQQLAVLQEVEQSERELLLKMAGAS